MSVSVIVMDTNSRESLGVLLLSAVPRVGDHVGIESYDQQWWKVIRVEFNAGRVPSPGNRAAYDPHVRVWAEQDHSRP